MYQLDPPAIYVSERVLARKETSVRAKNVVESLGKTMEETIYMADEDIPEGDLSFEGYHRRKQLPRLH